MECTYDRLLFAKRENCIKKTRRNQRLGNDDGMSCARKVVKLPRRNSSRHHCPRLSITKQKIRNRSENLRMNNRVAQGNGWSARRNEIVTGERLDLDLRNRVTGCIERENIRSTLHNLVFVFLQRRCGFETRKQELALLSSTGSDD